MGVSSRRRRHFGVLYLCRRKLALKKALCCLYLCGRKLALKNSDAVVGFPAAVLGLVGRPIMSRALLLEHGGHLHVCLQLTTLSGDVGLTDGGRCLISSAQQRLSILRNEREDLFTPGGGIAA